ncbi:conserved Plasmodium protein, unknown function [Plasmodium ovale curtisi]|uniref:RNA-editing substrate-binding complex 6 protein domain-containing protein n=1 Tax=Plasmodium ovale curtisi TaxID=864141 RepID=A0A1A8WH82_PLAOA|nr:conserved Plasmodium protein, unknown function [Plasmodium ovale curtisi]
MKVSQTVNVLTSKALQNARKEKGYMFYSTGKKSFGDLYPPRKRCEKIKHLDILNEVYFDMTDAIKEKNNLEMEEYKNFHKNICEIIIHNSISKKNEVIKNIMRYCIELNGKKKQIEKDGIQKQSSTKWDSNSSTFNTVSNVSDTPFRDSEEEAIFEVIKGNVREYSNEFNSCDIGIILKCLIKIKRKDTQLISILLHHFFKRNMKFSQYGTLYVLNSFSKWKLLPQYENNFKLLCFNILQKLDDIEIKILCLMCNYVSSLYSFNRSCVANFIQRVCNFLVMKWGTRTVESAADNGITTVWTAESIHHAANACARVNYLNKEMFQLWKSLIEKRVSEFSLDELVSLTNAYSKFKSAEDANFLSLFVLIAEQVIKKSYALKPRHLSVLANSFNNACILHEKLFHIITDMSLMHISCFEPKQIVMIIHSYVNIGLLNNRLLDTIWNYAGEFIHEYTMQELSMLLQAYTKSSQHREIFFNQLIHRIYSYITSAYPFLKRGSHDSEKYDHQRYVHISALLSREDYLSTDLTDEKLPLLFYFIYHQKNYCAHQVEHHAGDHAGDHADHTDFVANDGRDELTTSNETTCGEYNSYNKVDNVHVNKVRNEKDEPNLPTFTYLINEKNQRNGRNSTNSDETILGVVPHYVEINGELHGKASYVLKESTDCRSVIMWRRVPNEEAEVPLPDGEKMENALIKHISKDINATLLCSVIYSLIKGNCLLQYELLICLSKLSIIFLRHFKSTELANVCVALSQAYIRASDENDRQNNIISRNQKEEKLNNPTQQTSQLTTNYANENAEYDEMLYNFSKRYLIVCIHFFDNVEFYLKKKKNAFTDVYSAYKFVTSFGSLRMDKYAPVALHVFRLHILLIKHLSYLPLQKMVKMRKA